MKFLHRLLTIMVVVGVGMPAPALVAMQVDMQRQADNLIAKINGKLVRDDFWIDTPSEAKKKLQSMISELDDPQFVGHIKDSDRESLLKKLIAKFEEVDCKAQAGAEREHKEQAVVRPVAKTPKTAEMQEFETRFKRIEQSAPERAQLLQLNKLAREIYEYGCTPAARAVEDPSNLLALQKRIEYLRRNVDQVTSRGEPEQKESAAAFATHRERGQVDAKRRAALSPDPKNNVVPARLSAELQPSFGDTAASAKKSWNKNIVFASIFAAVAVIGSYFWFFKRKA